MIDNIARGIAVILGILLVAFDAYVYFKYTGGTLGSHSHGLILGINLAVVAIVWFCAHGFSARGLWVPASFILGTGLAIGTVIFNAGH